MIVWANIKNHPNYEVNNFGEVRNKKTGRILKQRPNERGYMNLMIDGITEKTHRLVADSFFDGDHSGLDVNHIDCNKQNNFIGNLEWCTRKENAIHALQNGLIKSSKKIYIVETGRTFNSISECAREMHGDRGCIRECINNKQKTYRGYHFKLL